MSNSVSSSSSVARRKKSNEERKRERAFALSPSSVSLPSPQHQVERALLRRPPGALLTPARVLVVVASGRVGASIRGRRRRLFSSTPSRLDGRAAVAADIARVVCAVCAERASARPALQSLR